MAVFTKESATSQYSLTLDESTCVAVSIVVPVTERCEDLLEIYRAHLDILNRREVKHEFIFVIDGGFEREGDRVRALAHNEESVRVIQFSRPFGEATALAVGFEQAEGDVVVTLPRSLASVGWAWGRLARGPNATMGENA